MIRLKSLKHLRTLFDDRLVNKEYLDNISEAKDAPEMFFCEIEYPKESKRNCSLVRIVQREELTTN